MNKIMGMKKRVARKVPTCSPTTEQTSIKSFTISRIEILRCTVYDIVAMGRGLMVSIDTKSYSEPGFHFNLGRLLISASIMYIEPIISNFYWVV